MKKTLLLTLMTVSFISSVQAKSLFGTLDKYIIEKTGQVIEVASNEISDNGTAKYFDYKEGKRKTIDLSEISKSVKTEIAGVKAGEVILLTTGVANTPSESISRYCQVFNVFANGMADVGCKTYEEDNKKGVIVATRLDFIVHDISSVVSEIESLDGIQKGEVVELRVNTKNAKAERNVKVLAIFANGEALVQKIGFNFLDTSGIVYQSSVDRVQLSDLSKLK